MSQFAHIPRYNCWLAPTAREFLMSERGIGLGGCGLPISHIMRRGIDDRLFQSQVGSFRADPIVPSTISFQSHPGELASLATLFKEWSAGALPGIPKPSPEQVKNNELARLCKMLPSFPLPACDAYSVSHLVRLTQNLPANYTLPSASTKGVRLPPRGSAIELSTTTGQGRVTTAHVTEFCGFYHELQYALLSEIPWERVGWRASAPARIANAIASRILGIPVDMRLGWIVRASDVTALTKWAAGDPGRGGDDSQVTRLRPYVSFLVPKVRAFGGDPIATRRLRGAAWSVALDRALNTQAVWRRDATGNLAPLASDVHKRALARLWR